MSQTPKCSFTPEPWKIVEERAIEATLDGIEVQIASLSMSHFSYDDPHVHLNQTLANQAPFNARLMVTAPKLLAALKGIKPLLDYQSGMMFKKYQAEILAVDTAIASATGKQH